MNSENKDQSENSSITQSQPNTSPINQFNFSFIPEESKKILINLLKKRLDRKLTKYEHKIKEERETLKFIAKKFTEFEKTLIALTEGVKETQKANEEKVKKKEEEKKQKEQKEILKTHTSKSQAHKKLKIDTKNNYLTNRTVLNINKNKNNVNNISSTRYNYHTEIPKKEHVRPKTFKGRRPSGNEMSKIKVKSIKVDKIANVSTPVRPDENKAKTILTLSTDQKIETKKVHNSVIYNNKSKSIKKKIIPKNLELTKNFSEVETHAKKLEEFKSEKPEKKSINIIQDKLNKKHENKKGTGKKTVIKKTNDKNKKPQVKKDKKEEEKKEKNNIEEPKNEIKDNIENTTNKEENKKEEKNEVVKEEEKKPEKEDNKTPEIIKDNENNKEEIKEEKKEVEKLPEKKDEKENKNENTTKPEEKEEKKIEETNMKENEPKNEEPKKEKIITPITKEEEKKIEKTEPIEQKDNIINKAEPPKEEKIIEPDKKEENIEEEKKPEENQQESNKVISEEEILKSLKEEELKIIKENETNNLLITKEEEPKKEENESPTETKPLEEEKKNDEVNNENKPQKENNENVIETFKKHNEEVKENEEELLKHYQSQLIDINLNQSINQNMSFSQSFLQSRSILGEVPQEKIARDPNAPLTRDEILKKYKNYFIYVFDFLDFNERIMFSGIHKGFKNERIYLLNTKREEAIASLELKERETLNDRINKFMTSYSKSEYTKPLGKFSAARNSANAVVSIDKEMFSKIFKQKVLDIKLSDIYIVYRVLFVLIGEPKIAEIVDDGEFWIKCIEYLTTNGKNKIGSFILEKSKNFDFSHKSIYLLNKLLVGIKPKFNPASFSKINGTTGLIIFIIKDALEYAGILVTNKTPKNRIYDNLIYYKNLIEPLTNFIDFLSKIKVEKK